MSLALTFRNVAGFLLGEEEEVATVLLLCLNTCMRRAYLRGLGEGGEDDNNPMRDFRWMAYSRCVFVAHTLLRQTRSSGWSRKLHEYNTSLPKIVQLAKAAQTGVERHVRKLVGNPRLRLPDTLLSPPACNTTRTHARYRREVSSWLAWNHRFVQSELHLLPPPPPPPPRKRAKLWCHDGEYVFLSLPSEIWRLVVDYMAPTPHDACGMVDACRGFRRVARTHPLNKVLLHSYLRAHHPRPPTHQMTTSYQALVTSVNTSRGVLREMQENAHGTYAHLLNITSSHTPPSSPSTSEIRQLDHNMLSMYGMNSLMFMHPDLLARKSMLVGPDKAARQEATALGRGGYLHEQMRTNEMVVKVRAMSLELALNATATTMTHHLTQFLGSMHALHAWVGGGEEQIVPPQLDSTTTMQLSQMLASQNACPVTWLRKVLAHMERELATRVIHHAVAQAPAFSPFHTGGVDKWFHYMSGLYHNRGGSGSTCVKMRLAVTPVELGGECTSTSLLYTHISVGGGEELVLPAFSMCWGWGVWPPANVTASTADLVVVKWGGKFWARTTPTPQAEHAKTWLQESNADLRGVMTRHGKIIGRCAPCGRTLKIRETWIGSTCSSHLP